MLVLGTKFRFSSRVVLALTAEPSLWLAVGKYFSEALCTCGHQEYWNEFGSILAFPFCVEV